MYFKFYDTFLEINNLQILCQIIFELNELI